MLDFYIEQAAVVFGLAYVIAIVFERSIGWLFGILNSVVSIWLFYRINLKAESVLYIYYVVAGIYGWWNWSKSQKSKLNKSELQIQEYSLLNHLALIVFGGIASVGLAEVLIAFNSGAPYIDAFTTVFAFIATWLTTKKVFSNWIYWIVVDIVSTYLYYSRGLEFYSALMFLYTVIAFIGAYNWNKERRSKVTS